MSPNRRTRSLVLVAVVGLAGFVGCATDSTTQAGQIETSKRQEFTVTLENMVEGQPFSPGVVVAHAADVHVWQQGEPAIDGVRAIAEDGDAGPAVEQLEDAEGISAVVDTGAPLDRQRGEADVPTRRTFDLSVGEQADRISVAVMLICTNDGFTGIDGLELPIPGERTVVNLQAYDAGTEANTEAWGDIVDPCQQIGPLSAEPDGNERATAGAEGSIGPHPGIEGGSDLDPELHGWNGTVARLAIEAPDSGG